MLKYSLIIFLVIFTKSVTAQENVSLENMREAYQSLNYEEVISITSVILNSSEIFTDEERIEIFTMRGVSYYSLNQIDDSRKSFFELLKINNEFELNPTLISPKIIVFFDNLKNDYKSITNNIISNEITPEVIETNTDPSEAYTREIIRQKNTMIQSVLLPGLGHIYSDESTKGWILLTANAGLLGGIIYSIIETNSREEKYLGETNKDLLAQRYEQFNDMYKTRNLLIGAYVALWLYTQIDLLLFNDKLPDELVTLNKMPDGFLSTGLKFNLNIRL